MTLKERQLRTMENCILAEAKGYTRGHMCELLLTEEKAQQAFSDCFDKFSQHTLAPLRA